MKKLMEELFNMTNYDYYPVFPTVKEKGKYDKFMGRFKPLKFEMIKDVERCYQKAYTCFKINMCQLETILPVWLTKVL